METFMRKKHECEFAHCVLNYTESLMDVKDRKDLNDTPSGVLEEALEIAVSRFTQKLGELLNSSSSAASNFMCQSEARWIVDNVSSRYGKVQNWIEELTE